MSLLILLALALAGCSPGGGETDTTTTAPPQTTAAPPPPPPPSPPPPPPLPPPRTNGLPPDITSFAQGGEQAATGLRGLTRCEQTARRRAVADLSWRPASRPGSEQRIVMAIDDAQFWNGGFDASKPLPPAASSVLWTRVRGASIHTWRVLTRHGETWTASKPARFEGELCEADFQGPG